PSHARPGATSARIAPPPRARLPQLPRPARARTPLRQGAVGSRLSSRRQHQLADPPFGGLDPRARSGSAAVDGRAAGGRTLARKPAWLVLLPVGRPRPSSSIKKSKKGKPMLTQPTLSQLQRLKLSGMAQALEEQLRQPDTHSLSFEERLALLVQ